jgi:TolB protein
MAADGSDPQRVTSRATECDTCGDRFGSLQGLDYSPDGETILFSLNRGDGNVTLWTVDEDGGEPHKILEGRFGTIGGSFSPNGRKIVYSDSPTGVETHLYKIRIDGTHRSRLTESGDDNLNLGADWGPRLSD